ncbi:biopolymer transport ExbD protein [Flavobacterium limi]|uniref:Biopolymer transport ExbD protein n=2 Tax=Flavobacterium limi TaxID=2045105 RepID=A0ABQ1UD69_9FLAO|nr:biopolymer transport ExbD protein [Flavobacterium limi]
MVTIELAKPKIMALGLPDKDPIWDGVINCGAGIDYRVMTVLLDDNNKIITYSGLLGYSDKLPKKVEYGAKGIRKVLLNKKKNVQKYTGNTDKGAIVIIKPSKKCNFKNLVDILDEMAISKIDTYVIVNDFSSEESKLLAAN